MKRTSRTAKWMGYRYIGMKTARRSMRQTTRTVKRFLKIIGTKKANCSNKPFLLLRISKDLGEQPRTLTHDSWSVVRGL